jgi:NitT/TauT family transport system permease protein
MNMATSTSRSAKNAQRALPLLVLIVFILLWEAAVRLGEFPTFILPPPSRIFDRFTIALKDGNLIFHTLVTLSEVVAGLAIGLSLATSLGYAIAKSRVLERIVAPYVVASQSIPVVAIAPLLIIWFGPGRLSKVLICSMIVFFPVLVNTIVGVRSVPEGLYDLMRSLRASRRQIFAKLEAPAAMPVLLGGLKIGATLSVIGAVVGEFVGSDQGLGFLINVGRGLFDTALVFVSVFMLAGMAFILYGFVALLERKALGWMNSNH